MTLPLVPAIVMIVGLLMYALSANAKGGEAGRIMFAFGLLVTLLALASWHALALH